MAGPREVFDFEDDALKHFVDREDALAAAHEMLIDTPTGDELPILVFHGIGGMGKSTLLQKIRHDICQQRRPEYREAHVPHSFVDFAHPSAKVHDAESLVHHIKRELASYDGFRFPRFELILARLRQLQGFAPADRPGEFPVLMKVLENLPYGIGNLLAAIRAAGELDCFKHRTYHRLNIADALEWEHPYQAEDRLAAALADDINDILQSGGRRPALLFDSLDWLNLRNERDGLVQSVTDLCDGLPAVPIIVGIRAQDEDQISRFPCFGTGRDLRCVAVDVIPDDDNGRYRREYLTSRGVGDESHDVIIDITGGHALWLGVAADIAVRIQEDEGRALTAQDLHEAAQNREKLFARLAEALDEKTVHRHLLRHACVCRWFDRKLLSAVTGREVTHEAFNTLTRLSMVRVARTDEDSRPTAWAVHQTVRDIALAWLADEEELQYLAARGVKYCAEQEDALWEVERLYFLMVTDPKEGRGVARWLYDNHVSFAWDRALGTEVIAAVRDGWRVRHIRPHPRPPEPWEIHEFRAFLDQMDGRYAVALAELHAALRKACAEGDRNGEGATLNNMATIHRQQGRYEQAMDLYEETLAIKRELGDRQGEGLTLNNMAIIHETQARYEQAMELHEEAVRAFRELGDRRGEGATLNNMAIIRWQQGRYQQAMALCGAALRAFRDLGHRHGEGMTLDNMAIIHGKQGRYQQAMKLYEESLAIFRELGDRHGEGQTLVGMANVHQTQGRYEQAMELYEQSLAICREVGDRHGEAQTLMNMANVHCLQSRHQQAMALHEGALRALRELGDRHGEGVTLINMGLLAEETGDPSAAREYWQEALAALVGLGVPEEATVREYLATLDWLEEMRGKSDEAEDPREGV